MPSILNRQRKTDALYLRPIQSSIWTKAPCPHCGSFTWTKRPCIWWKKLLHPNRQRCFCRQCREEFWLKKGN
ncbi:hypothetical protein HMY34_11780 [Thiothrix subterranea]|uniref:hypothetical protein n=1 Tax=Thiothrix subterranea TaxID=2735563 RepID=UPI00192B2921|nr:hypothetical protein [Thiothrix subterranea]QQZ29397.1 hypothetical protein HMY34_11780 [Thiothrix subterranea]